MTVTTGLVLDGGIDLVEILRPLAEPLQRCYWVVDSQMSPFDRWFCATPNSEEILSLHHVDVPECRMTSTDCWRPGTIPKLCTGTPTDEWTYFFAIEGSEEEVKRRAARIAIWIGNLSAEFFAELDTLADLFLMHVDGWWELYTGRQLWHDILKTRLPDSRERSSRHSGESLR